MPETFRREAFLALLTPVVLAPTFPGLGGESEAVEASIELSRSSDRPMDRPIFSACLP